MFPLMFRASGFCTSRDHSTISRLAFAPVNLSSPKGVFSVNLVRRERPFRCLARRRTAPAGIRSGRAKVGAGASVRSAVVRVQAREEAAEDRADPAAPP
jgi:hypothetical protein